MSWKKEKIGNHCEITSSKRIFYSEYVDSGVPFYRSKEIIEKVQGQQISEPLYISEQKYNDIKKRFGVPVAGDMLLTSVGTIGVPYIVKPEDHFYFKDGNLTWFRNFDEHLSSKFLCYWIGSKEGYGVLNNTTIGSSQKALTISSLNQIKCPMPNITVQARIVDILSAYDDLIENNQKQIKLLEEAAQRLYKEWFIDLRFPGHENAKIVDGVPEGWEKHNLDELLSFEIGGGWGEDNPVSNSTEKAFVVRGTDLNDIKYGRFRDIPCRFHTKNSLDSRGLCDGDIIFEVSGGSKDTGAGRSLLMRSNILNFIKTPVICASFCKMIRLKNINLVQLFYDYLQYLKSSRRTEIYDKRSASSIVNFRWKDFLKQETILIPTEDILDRYNSIAVPTFNKIMNSAIQIHYLQKAKDSLLPKLMNGEVEV